MRKSPKGLTLKVLEIKYIKKFCMPTQIKSQATSVKAVAASRSIPGTSGLIFAIAVAQRARHICYPSYLVIYLQYYRFPCGEWAQYCIKG